MSRLGKGGQGRLASRQAHKFHYFAHRDSPGRATIVIERLALLIRRQDSPGQFRAQTLPPQLLRDLCALLFNSSSSVPRVIPKETANNCHANSSTRKRPKDSVQRCIVSRHLWKALRCADCDFNLAISVDLCPRVQSTAMTPLPLARFRKKKLWNLATPFAIMGARHRSPLRQLPCMYDCYRQ
jgi:hypothetical protein